MSTSLPFGQSSVSCFTFRTFRSQASILLVGWLSFTIFFTKEQQTLSSPPLAFQGTEEAEAPHGGSAVRGRRLQPAGGCSYARACAGVCPHRLREFRAIFKVNWSVQIRTWVGRCGCCGRTNSTQTRQSVSKHRRQHLTRTRRESSVNHPGRDSSGQRRHKT